MNKKTLKALHGSINKWIKIVKGEAVDEGERNCPLCQIFNKEGMNEDEACLECPVMARTKYRHCCGTPYSEWARLGGGGSTAETPELKKAAQAELAFLQSLLPSHDIKSGKD